MIRILILACFVTAINLVTVFGDELQLRLCNVVFRHGDRTPDAHETYPTDQYGNNSFYPTGRGGLTIDGKQREYSLGQQLKSLYGNFLGPYYTPSIVEARSTDVQRTKMSLQLVLNALFPPTLVQIWNKTILWQPIPTIYWRIKEDYILRSEQCPRYGAEFRRILNTTVVKKKLAQFKGLATTLSNLTGLKIHDISTLYELYLTFTAQNASGLVLPNWVYDYWPNGELLNATELYYELSYYNNNLKRLGGGMLLHKILTDLVNFRNGTHDNDRKMFLYSAHEVNIASLQSALGVYLHHVPAYSSAMIMELWEKDKEYFVKVLYYKGIPSEVITLQIPGCHVLCPLDRFIKLLKPVTATPSDLECT